MALVILTSCVRNAPVSHVVKQDNSEWQATLQECIPSANPNEYLCPRHTLERAYDTLAEMYVDGITCRNDLKAERAICKVNVARVEAELDSPWRQWWLWGLIGVVVGAAAGVCAGYELRD